MDWKRSSLKIYGDVLLGFLLLCIIQISSSLTDPTDGKRFFLTVSIGIFIMCVSIMVEYYLCFSLMICTGNEIGLFEFSYECM